MFSLFKSAFGLDASKIGEGLKKNLLGDYAEDVGQLVTDIRGDVGATVTSWGQSLGLLEDPKADLDLMVDNAQQEMQPIIDKYRPPELPRPRADSIYDGDSWDGYEEPELKVPDEVKALFRL